MNQASLTYIHPEAKIGKNVTIEPFTRIHEDVEIGDNCWIASNVTIMKGARIGNNVHIFPGAVISAIPQDMKFKGEETTAEIGDNTTLREYVTVNRGTKAKDKTAIGENCLIMAYSHVAHDCFLGNNVIIGNTSQLAGEIVIDDFAIFSGLVAVHQFVHVGAHVMISGGALVRKDVPPYVKAGREPLSYAGVNVVGLRRRNFTEEQITAIHKMYRIIFQNGYNNQQALRIIEEQFPDSKEKENIIQFVRSASRGIIKGYLNTNNGKNY